MRIKLKWPNLIFFLFTFEATTHKFRTESSNWGWNKFIKIDVNKRNYNNFLIFIRLNSFLFKDLISGGFYNEQTDSIMLEVLVSIKKIES
jgi:hypothetical protein